MVNQINGHYDTREPQLQRYLRSVKDMARFFSSVDVQHIPRSQNKCADALSIS